MFRNNSILILAAISFLLACRNVPQVSAPPCMTSYSSLEDSILASQPIYSFVDSVFATRRLIDCDSAIILHGQGGWGYFEFLAAIYNDADSCRVEMFDYVRYRRNADLMMTLGMAQYKDWGLVRRRSDVISKSSWNVLFEQLTQTGFWCIPHEANNCYGTVDGNEFTMIVKAGEYQKSIYWGECYLDDIWNRRKGCGNFCREMILMSRQVLEQTGYPFGYRQFRWDNVK